MLRQTLNDAMKAALKNKDKRRLATVRLVLAAIKDRDIAARTGDNPEGLNDEQILELLSKMVKQRKESMVTYEEAGRLELAEQEREEIEIISEFMPQQMSDAEIDEAVAKVIDAIGAEGLKDIGRVMAGLKADYAGQMDFAKASAAVKAKLS